MCTLTIAPVRPDYLRLAFNRDERPTRSVASPPAEPRRFGSRLAVFPVDPVSGGTWIAVNDVGLALAVLNVNLGSMDRPVPRRSRGTLIPALLHTDSPTSALETAGKLFDYHDFAPFRLVLTGDGTRVVLRWDGREPSINTQLPGESPSLFTSSGLGDELVEGVRRELFDTCFAAKPEDWLHVQERFHRHSWPGREHLSVNMMRATARTVSYTTLELRPNSATMTYHPAAPDQPADDTTVQLPFVPAPEIP